MTNINLKSGKSLNSIQLSDAAITCHFYRSVKNAGAEWDELNSGNIFLQSTYLEVLELYPPEHMQFCYFLFYKNGKAIGKAACQVQYFNAEKSIQKETSKDGPCFFRALGGHIKGYVASKVDFNTLVCGNLLLTGEHGFYFKKDQFSQVQQFNLVNEALTYGQTVLAEQGIKISATLYKEFFNKTAPLTEKGFGEFTVQPNMIMPLQSAWNNFDDYKAALSSKYRVRVKRAFKKGADLTKVELDAAAIEANLDTMYALYEQVAANSGFNLINLNKAYLLGLKQALGNDFRLFAYYLDGQMIAYFTLIMNGDEMEAHFLGFDKSYNNSHQIYLNILLDLVTKGIEAKAHQIVFARTAMTIKSSIGAEPHEMYCYVQHRNYITNRFITPLFDFLQPSAEWEMRHPFKKSV